MRKLATNCSWYFGKKVVKIFHDKASANSDFGYVTLCDTTAIMVLCTKGTLLQVTTDKFKYKVKQNITRQIKNMYN